MALFDVSNELANQRAAAGIELLLLVILLCWLISYLFRNHEDGRGGKKDYWL